MVGSRQRQVLTLHKTSTIFICVHVYCTILNHWCASCTYRRAQAFGGSLLNSRFIPLIYLRSCCVFAAVRMHSHVHSQVSLSVRDRLADQPNGHYIVMTGINPTPLGEGKSTTTIGLTQVLCT
jgi:Formate--tetrahydrofolate ligase